MVKKTLLFLISINVFAGFVTSAAESNLENTYEEKTRINSKKEAPKIIRSLIIWSVATMAALALGPTIITLLYKKYRTPMHPQQKTFLDNLEKATTELERRFLPF